jgi:hypothetical protein
MKTISRVFFILLAISPASWALAQDSTPQPGPASTSGVMAGVDPRVTEVNNRLLEQVARIKAGVKSGTLTRETAKPLGQQVKAIRAQEKAFFTQNGKRELTDDQLTQLNQSLNDNSKAIFAAKHGGAAPAASTDTTSASTTTTTSTSTTTSSSTDPDSDSSN